jgi:hypothetical protein
VQLVHFDSRIAVTCGLCMASSQASESVVVNVTGMLLPANLPTADTVEVTFGAIPAKSVIVSSQSGGDSSLLVTPPDYLCSQCTYARGEARVLLTVFSKQGTTISASTSFSFFSSPAVENCRFDTKGTSILLTFDQPTDRAGMSFADNDCRKILTANSLLSMGVNPKCFWQSSSDSVVINLGHSAVLLPGSSISVLAGVLRSANRVSTASELITVVQLPAEIARPTVTISGKSMLDACSNVALEAVASSPRPLRYVWRANDTAVAAQLRTLDTANVFFAYPTSLGFLEPGNSYLFSVTVQDFFGTSSAPALFTLTILWSPLPQVCVPLESRPCRYLSIPGHDLADLK